MLFEAAKATFVAADMAISLGDELDSWGSDEEITAAMSRVLGAERAVARTPAPHAAGVAFKVELALRMLDEAEEGGMLSGRLQTMLRGVLADLRQGDLVPPVAVPSTHTLAGAEGRGHDAIGMCRPLS